MPRKIFPLLLNDKERQQLKHLAAKDARSESAMLRYLLMKAARETKDTSRAERSAA